MRKRINFFGLVLSVVLAACVAKAATVARPIPAAPPDASMRAALAAAAETGWTPTTVSAETGYFMAERGAVIVGSENKNYRMQVQLPSTAGGEVRVTVTPPPGVMGGPNTTTLANDFLAALERALGR